MEMTKEFEWCYKLEQEVIGCFYDENDTDTDLTDSDTFIVKGRDLDEENNQYFQVQCVRTGNIYDVPASLLN